MSEEVTWPFGTGAQEGAVNPMWRGCPEGLDPVSAVWAPDPASPGPQAEIFQAFTELFQVACARPPPLGLCDYPSSRAMYAIDLMLKWDSRPDGEGAPLPRNPKCPPHLPKGGHSALPTQPTRGQREGVAAPSPRSALASN